MARHVQITQNNKFAISLEELKKLVSAKVNILYVLEHKSVLQIDTNFDGDVKVFPNSPKEQVCNVFAISQKRSYRSSCFFACR